MPHPATKRIERWIRLAIDELECAILSAEHFLLPPSASLSTTHTFIGMLEYHPEIADDSLCFTPTKMVRRVSRGTLSPG